MNQCPTCGDERGLSLTGEWFCSRCDDDERERLAAYAHEAWSGWMDYLFSKCDVRSDTSVVIPRWAVDRWTRQMNTPYAELPESEKESDRAEADRMLAIVHRSKR